MLYWDMLLKPKRIREYYSMEQSEFDYRTPFKKDFDTICNSNVLRRLQDKAQIFPLEKEDYARTRLTHSIEVLSVAESLGVFLVDIINKKENEKYLIKSKNSDIESLRKRVNDIPMILKCAALLHDMGNPPFGHLGEQAINDWFGNNLPQIILNTDIQKYEHVSKNDYNSLYSLMSKNKQQLNDLLYFDGNAQLLRLVTKLSYVVDDNGMNLTFPVMAAFIKYPCNSISIEKGILTQKKAGYFMTEQKVFDAIVTNLGLKKGSTYVRHPLAFLIEAADDIAYLSADVEDAHHKGLISVDELLSYIDVYTEAFPEINEKIMNEIKVYKDKALKDNLPNREDYVMHRTRILLKGMMINEVERVISSKYKELMNGDITEELLDISNAKGIVEAIRDFEKEKIYYGKDIKKNKTRANFIIKKILDTIVLGILNYNSEIDHDNDTENNLIYESLSPNYRYICENACKNAKSSDMIYYKLRLAVDQVAGMTDSRDLSSSKLFTAG